MPARDAPAARRPRPSPQWWRWSRGLRDLAGLLLPVACAGCGRPDQAVCAACRGELDREPLLVEPAVPASPPVLAAGVYAGVVRSLLVAWKDHGRVDAGAAVAEALSAPLAAGVAALGASWPGDDRPVLLVPAASSRAARRRRGGDRVEVAARAAAAAVRDARGLAPWPVQVAPVLRQHRGVRDQAGLGAQDRATNLLGAVRVVGSARLEGSLCVTVDDVVTTGATLAASADALRRRGACVPLAVVVAATPRHRPLGRPGALRTGDGPRRGSDMPHGSQVV